MIEETTAQVMENGHLNSLCQHYWIIDEPSGPVSKGVCRRCNEIREFKNFVEEIAWADEPPGPPGE